MWLRRLLPAILLVAGRPALAAPGGWRFEVLRNGEKVGTHTVSLEARGAQLVAVSDLSVAPRVLGVVVYRYEHRYTEVTEHGRFRRVESRLNRNGRIIELRAEATASAVVVEGPAGEVRLPPDAAPLSWWQPQRFGRVPIFGTTTGQAMEVRFLREKLPGGGERVLVRGEIEVELLYDAAGSWRGFAARGDDGSAITYAAE